MIYLKLSCQKGFTLVELMVSLTLGLLLTAGILEVYSATKKTYNFNMELARMQEDQRFISTYLQNNIRMAGWRPDPTQEKNTIFNPITIQPTINNKNISITMEAGQVIAGAQTNNMDIVVIRKRTSSSNNDERTRDCFGNFRFSDDTTRPPVNEIISIFYVLQEDNLWSLYCKSYNDNVLDQTQPIISNITGMALRYGTSTPAFQYRSVDNMPGFWNNVVSLRMELLFQSTQQVASAPQSYNFPSWNNTPTPRNDHYLRQVLSTTINIRN